MVVFGWQHPVSGPDGPHIREGKAGRPIRGQCSGIKDKEDCVTGLLAFLLRMV
jgi:hypothetical protein